MAIHRFEQNDKMEGGVEDVNKVHGTCIIFKNSDTLAIIDAVFKRNAP